MQTTPKNGQAVIINFETIDTPPVSELEALAKDINFDVVSILNYKAHNRQFMGKGQMESVQAFIDQNSEITHVIYNGFLSGLKYKLLRKYIKRTILSRVDIIIQVFEKRANTQEGMLQVKLAALLHQRSKLVRYWSHLERQRGGTRGIGGPGETQLELDKRIINDKMMHIKKDLKKIAQDRQVRSKSRLDPIVSLVGYSNAGKTTLFNLLTNSQCNVSNKPFETLDPFLRPCILPNDQKILISDTVGFVTHLPPFLIKAFRATLEQITQAQTIICVHDSTNPEGLDEIQHWLKVLKVDNTPIIYALNKADLNNNQHNIPNAIEISSKTGYGINKLQEAIGEKLDNFILLETTLPYDAEQALSWIMKNAMSLQTKYKEDSIEIIAKLSKANFNKFNKLYSTTLIK